MHKWSLLTSSSEPEVVISSLPIHIVSGSVADELSILVLSLPLVEELLGVVLVAAGLLSLTGLEGLRVTLTTAVEALMALVASWGALATELEFVCPVDWLPLSELVCLLLVFWMRTDGVVSVWEVPVVSPVSGALGGVGRSKIMALVTTKASIIGMATSHFSVFAKKLSSTPCATVYIIKSSKISH